MTYWTVVWCCVLWVLTSHSQYTFADFSDDDYKLDQLLFGPNSKYNKNKRPSNQVDVKIAFTLHTLHDLDTKEQSMTVSGWLIMTWQDPRLRWTPSEYGDIEEIFESRRIWRPEIIIRNSLDNLGVLKDTNLLLFIDHTGLVTWQPPGRFSTSCVMTVTHYPFDRQKCSLEISSWAYTSKEVNLSLLERHILLDDYHPNGEWHLQETHISRKEWINGKRIIAQLDYTLVMERRVSFYLIKVILPVMLLSFLSIMTFILPFESGEKVSYALTVVLAYTFVMLDVLQGMPPTSINTSILGIYLSSILFVGCSTTAMSIINLSMYYHNRIRPTGKTRAFIINILAPLTNWRKLDFERLSGLSKTEVPRKNEVTIPSNKTEVLPSEELATPKIKIDHVPMDEPITLRSKPQLPLDQAIRSNKTQILRVNEIKNKIKFLAMDDMNSPIGKTRIQPMEDDFAIRNNRRKTLHGDDKVMRVDKDITFNVNIENIVVQKDFYTWREIAQMCDVACFRIFTVVTVTIAVVYQVACHATMFSMSHHH